jgi:hypothetical protein
MSGTNTYASSGANSASTAGPSSESSVQPTILVHVLYTGDRAAELHEAFIHSETQELKLAALVHEDMKALHLPRGTKHNISWTDGPTPFATMKWVFSTHEAVCQVVAEQNHNARSSDRTIGSSVYVQTSPQVSARVIRWQERNVRAI